MNFVRKRISLAIAMDKLTEIKSHNVTGTALMVKRLEPSLVPFRTFILDFFFNNLITVSMLADIPLNFARNPPT